MNGFYASIMIIGILLVIIAIFSIFLGKRKVFQLTRALDEKKQELSEIISDAEQMIDELNRFSDYIVTQMDLKSEELNKNLQEAEERVHALTERGGTVGVSSVVTTDDGIDVMEAEVPYAVNSTVVSNAAIGDMPTCTADAASAAYNMNKSMKSSATVRKKEKVIPFNNRYSEVMRLAGEGLESLEIARKLHMGKGEVELIIGLRK